MVTMKTSAEGPAPAPAAGRATIDDVARAAAVSRQTVSNIVRGRGRFSRATRDWVLTAISQLGYEPHTGTASLRSGRAHRIAYPIPDAELRIDNTIMLEFLEVLVDATRQRRHQLLVTSSYGNPVQMLGD
jgi:DNA-binding LacI/PurR family transcriptional regulator